MAVVLNSEENSYFSSGPLHRSHSQPKFVTTSSTLPKSPSRCNSINGFPLIVLPRTPSSLEASSPRIFHTNRASCSFTARSNIPQLPRRIDDEEENQVVFPSYEDVDQYQQANYFESPTSPCTEDSYTVTPTLSPVSNSPLTTHSRPESPELVEHAEDDTAIRIQPSRHVDYLSHNWREEDIWSSWKYIVSKRKAYNNSARLENASWRTWIKAKYKLKTVSPETLNWLKDCDVTWLYGPLQPGSHCPFDLPSPRHLGDSRMSKTNSFLNKKPILKKRSMSEIMLQKSLSSSSLLKQAAAAVQAQQTERPDNCVRLNSQQTERPDNCVRLNCPSKSFVYALSTRRSTGLHPSYISSMSSSDLPSPSNGDKKRIHFNEQVEQCIALEVKGDDDEEILVDDYNDSDSDDGGIMMKPSNSKRRLPPMKSRKKPCASPNQESKTIAMLPSTTLKYRPDTPDILEMEVSNFHDIQDEIKLPSASSQPLEILRPSKPSTMMLFADDDDDHDDDMNWEPPSDMSCGNKDLEIPKVGLISSSPLASSLDLTGDGHSPLRRTSSGMFMPYEEEEEVTSDGLFGRVVDTVNTAKDIAHVIWNVGWRR
ncbi:hypothetical protein BGT96224_A20378 [Blumeria graminis f. sp. tritici 96224]|uniref:Nitrogen regulatory protein areA GATA-like domain-containing protein n=1 Tax=Blumeria graminis f. sp. tritici 96224 TaxID=1268274 RepID=A0A656KL93_BLUGR|nr:hypothetical protein BGT96224_A20378 [Blumeria graminis f. sp. tritici 96224]